MDYSRNVSTEDCLKMLFLGDLMLDRGIRSLIEKRGTRWLTGNIVEIFQNKDFVVANLEGCVTNKMSCSTGTKKGEKGHLSFTFDPRQTKEILGLNNINIVCLGNNHTFNFKERGLHQTQQFLEKVGCLHFGDPYDRTKTVVYKQMKGKKIAFVTYSRFKSGLSVEEIGEIIGKAKREADLVVVYAHWGKEYKLVASEKQTVAGHHFIDIGADLIIGTHPHVIQPIEIYKEKVIFYSLGNFVFDQSFSENVRTRLAVDVCLNQDKMVISLVPLYYDEDGSLRFADKDLREKLFGRIMDNSTSSKLKEGISLEKVFTK